MAENTELLEKVLERVDDLTDIKVQVGVLTTQMQALIEANRELTLAIRGNGKPGLNDRVRNLEDITANHPVLCPVKLTVDDLKKDKDKRDEERKEAEQDRKDQAREKRKSLVGFVVSVVLLLLSTGINIVLVLTHLK